MCRVVFTWVLNFSVKEEPHSGEPSSGPQGRWDQDRWQWLGRWQGEARPQYRRQQARAVKLCPSQEEPWFTTWKCALYVVLSCESLFLILGEDKDTFLIYWKALYLCGQGPATNVCKSRLQLLSWAGQKVPPAFS